MKKCSSVSTDRQVAPFARYIPAISSGSNASRMIPLLGEPFFTSAMMAVRPEATAFRKARSKPRGMSSRPAMRDFSSRRGVSFRATATSSRLCSLIFFRISAVSSCMVASLRVVPGTFPLIRQLRQPLKLPHGAARIDGLGGQGDAFCW